jgi:hypothetical protein
MEVFPALRGTVVTTSSVEPEGERTLRVTVENTRVVGLSAGRGRGGSRAGLAGEVLRGAQRCGAEARHKRAGEAKPVFPDCRGP